MKRGEIHIAIGEGDFGKARPFVIVQANELIVEASASYLACPTTTDLQNHSFRMPLPANAATGLKVPSEVMVEKVGPLKPHRLRARVGQCSDEQMRVLDGLLAFVLGLRGG